jgi:hypothetical protein
MVDIHPSYLTNGCISVLQISEKRAKIKKLVKLGKKSGKKMTPEDQQCLKAHLKQAA